MMKKYLLSPLCSAFIVPGLGQILNHNLKKGLIVLSVVFILLIGTILKLAFIINKLVQEHGIPSTNARTVLEMMKKEDLSVLWAILILFAIIWVYSVLDAFLTGKKMESQTEGNNL